MRIDSPRITGSLIVSSSSSNEHSFMGGSVGIGTTNPNTIGTSGASTLTILSQTTSGVLELQNKNANSTNEEFGKIEFQNLNNGSTVTGRVLIIAQQDGAHNSSRLLH